MNIEYELIRSKRKTISLQVTAQARLVVRAPKSVAVNYIDNLLNSKRDWIEKKINQLQTRIKLPILTQLEIKDYKKKAKIILNARLSYWAEIMDLKYKSFRLSSAKTRWGSCSGLNVISLNWKLILTQPHLVDYVAIHELAHVVQKNHSQDFWNLVGRFDSAWKSHRKELAHYSNALNL